MLSFSPPFRLIGGHAVFADHADPGQFYVLPDMPRLAEATNGVPGFSLTRFLGDTATGEALAGGFLSLQCELTIPNEKLQEIRTVISDELGRPVRISPALFDEGSVDLVLLGENSLAGTTATEPSDFEVSILGSGRPSIFGRNTAGFQIQLDNNAAAFIEASIGDATLPALVTYRLALSGLRPAFNMRVEADWTRVFQELHSKFKANVYYVRADMESRIAKALQTADVKIETTILDADAASEAERVERDMVKWVTETFFDPAFGRDPQPPGTGIVGEIKDNLLDIIDSLVPGASFKLKHIREEDMRSFAATIDRSVVRKREIVFQASLGGALHALRVDENGDERAEWPALRGTLVSAVNIASIPRREVTLGVFDRFESDGLSSVEVDIALIDPVTGERVHEMTEVFHDAAKRSLFAVNLLDRPAAFLTDPFVYRVRANFDPSSQFGHAEPAEGEWLQGRAAELIVDPRVSSDYRVRKPNLALVAGFPFAQFSQVHLEVRRRDEADVTRQSGQFTLTSERTGADWMFRGHGASPEAFEYRVTYDRMMAEGGPVTHDWRFTSEEQISLPDPLPQRRRLTVFLNLPFDRITMAFLEVRYEDLPNSVRIDERITLNAAQPFFERDYAIADPDVFRVMYRLTAFVPLQGLVQGDWHETDDTTVTIGPELFEHRNIRFRAIGLPPANHDLSTIRIEAEAQASDDTALHNHVIEIAPQHIDGDLGAWSFPKPEVEKVRIRATWRNENGFPGRIDWQDMTRDIAVLRLPDPQLVV